MIILASASPRRRELLAALGVPFVVRPTHADETEPTHIPAEQVAETIAARKAAAAVSAMGLQALVLAADTVVVLDGRSLGKPADAAEATAMLAALAGRPHQVYTAVVVASGNQQRCQTVRTDVIMRAYSTAEIAASVHAGTPFDKAGGYAIQDPLLHPVGRFDGCYCNVVGLPLWTVFEMLSDHAPNLGPHPPDAVFERCRSCPLRA